MSSKLSEKDLLGEGAATAEVEDQLASKTTEQIENMTKMFETNIRVMKSEIQRLNHAQKSLNEKIAENNEKLKINKQLPYLVANCVEILDVDPDGDDENDEGDTIDGNAGGKKSKCVVIKTSSRQTVFLPVIGLVEADQLAPGDLIGVNKDSYLVLDKLPAEYDSRVKAMEIDEKPTEDYSMVGGLDKQIEELIEAVVLPITHKDRFKALGIKPPKGVLMFGPPGTGKTLMARACAAKTEATFLKISAPQLVQMYIGDGAKMVRDAFALARERAPTIIFIDELDAIGTKRFDSDKSGDREVQRTMLELLNQLDGFSSDDKIKVIAATNRADILDPALLRSGRIDRKIEFPLPDESARTRILQIHARKMNVSKDVNYEEVSRCTEDFNGAQLKAVCVEAGMLALRRGANELQHEDFMEGINQVQAKKKASLAYYA
jgi:26S proteasome regulatory subunit T5